MDKIDRINIWFDNAGHYLDVHWVSKTGNYFMPTSNERVDVLVDDERNLSGFMVWGVTRVKEGEIVNLELMAVEPESVAALATTRPNQSHPAVQSGATMEIKNISIHTENAGDCLKVRWGAGDGHYAATGDDRAQALLDSSGNILGFKITGISQMGEGEKDYINVDLYPSSIVSESANPNS